MVVEITSSDCGKIRKGWYLPLGRKEYFIESTQVKKTRKFAEKILVELDEPVSGYNIDFILYYIIQANMEVRYCPPCPEFGKLTGNYYFNIYGKNFSGVGSADIYDGKTIVLSI